MTKKKDSGKEYTGVLAEPILFPAHPLETQLMRHFGKHEEADARWSEANLEVAKIQLQKLEKLINEFGLSLDDPSAYMKLALSLAHRHVPGFQVTFGKRKGPGAPRRDDLFNLGVEVLRLVQEKGLSERSACLHLAGKGAFKNDKGETLYRRYKELKKRTNTDGNSDKLLNELFGRLHPE
jgi:hypothetical protein